jgi:hypothetical protein
MEEILLLPLCRRNFRISFCIGLPAYRIYGCSGNQSCIGRNGRSHEWCIVCAAYFIFLIAESSFGYDLFIPLMIVSIISYLIAKWFSPISPELKLADEGILPISMIKTFFLL